MFRPESGKRKCPGLESSVSKDNRRPADRVACVTKALFAKAQLLQQLGIRGQVVLFGIVEEFATAGSHLQEAAAAVEVFTMRAQVLGQVIDASGQERDLDFGRTGILLVSFVGCDDFGFNNCGGHGFVVWFTTVGPPCRDRAARLEATEVAPEPASPFQSGGVPDQSWWRPATDGLPLTQGVKLPQREGGSKRKFGARNLLACVNLGQNQGVTERESGVETWRRSPNPSHGRDGHKKRKKAQKLRPPEVGGFVHSGVFLVFFVANRSWGSPCDE